MKQRPIEITSATGATLPLSHCHTWIGETQWAYSVQLANLTVCIEMDSSRQAEGREWSGGDGSGVEGRGGKGRAGQGRVPDCLGGLSRVGISSRSTRL